MGSEPAEAVKEEIDGWINAMVEAANSLAGADTAVEHQAGRTVEAIGANRKTRRYQPLRHFRVTFLRDGWRRSWTHLMGTLVSTFVMCIRQMAFRFAMVCLQDNLLCYNALLDKGVRF